MKLGFLILAAFLGGTPGHADTPGPVINKVCPTSQWIDKIVPGQQPECKQPYYTDIAGFPPAGVWGGISGTLSNQADLQAALNAKQNAGNYLTGLNSDVTASGPGVGAATVVSVAGSSANSIHNAEVAANAATNLNTASAIVKRDSSGNFAAGSISAALSGNATTATALASNPTDCGAGNYAFQIDAQGNLTCASVSDAQLSLTDITTNNVSTLKHGFAPKLPGSATVFLDGTGAYSTPADTGMTALTGDVSASGSGSVAATINSVGGSSAANVHLAEQSANAATNLNTPSTIVARDASGNFAAGAITASLTGNASTASALAAAPTGCGSGQYANAIAANGNLTCSLPPQGTVTNVTATSPLASSGGSTPNLTVTSGNLTAAGTDGIAVTTGTGAVLGSGTSIAQHVADTTHSGYLLSTDWTTFNGKQSALSFGALSDTGTDGITVTNGAGAVIGSGTSIAQHVADATHSGYLLSTDWSTFNGKQASGNYITALTGDVTASGPGSAASTLATVNASPGSVTYAALTVNAKGLVTSATSGTAPVTSVGLSVPATSILGVTGTPVTTTGTLGLTTTGTSGGIPYFSSTSQLSSSALLTANQLVVGGGAATAPASLGSLGTTSTVLHGNASGVPSFGSVVDADVSSSAAIAYSKLASMTTGQVLLGNAGTPTATTLSGDVTVGATGTTAIGVGKVTNSMLAGSIDLTSKVTNTLPVGNGGLGIATGTSGGILGFTGSTTIASSGALTANAIVLGGGAGATPSVLGSLGTTTTLLHGNAAGAPTFGAVALGTDVSGTLLAAQFPALTGDVTTSAGSLATTLAATSNGTLATLSASAGVAVHGSNTNNSASAGYVGEYIGSVVGPTNYPATGVWGDLTSISLTAGDWEVTGQLYSTLNGATQTGLTAVGVSTTSGNSATGLTPGDSRMDMTPPTSLADNSAAVAGYRMSLASTTTVYLKYRATYSAGTPQGYGRLSARRMR